MQISKDSKNSISKKLKSDIGVPQGSILGPILFLIYINDLDIFLNNSPLTMYADDTSLIVSGATASEAEAKANALLISLQQWFCANKLYLNPNKTQIMVFHNYQNKNNNKVNIKIDNKTLMQVSTIKFLGVHLSENLNWSAHCFYISKRLSSVSYQMKVLRTILNVNGLKTVYFANAHSLLSYGIIFWGNSSHSQDVFVAQKRIIRSLMKMRQRESCRQIFKQLKILTMASVYILEVAKYIYSNKINFNSNSSVHSHDTRNKNKFRLPKYSLTLSQNYITYIGLKIFNILPSEIKNKQSIKQFEFTLKKFLLLHSFYSLDEFFNFF